MKKKLLPWSILLIIGVVGVGVFYPGNKEEISAEVIEVPGGYGYVIKSRGKVIVRQEIIPAVQDTAPFCTYGDARAVAGLVRQKMLKKESPAITKEELKALHVRINCLVLAE